MNDRKCRWPSAFVALLLAAKVLPGLTAEPEWVDVQFKESEAIFANPGQGWMSQQRTPVPEPRFPCSVVYIRFNWAEVEPAEGEFQWRVIDDVIAAWKSRGATVAMRVMTCNAHSRGYDTSPAWLFAAGCKSFDYLVGGDDPTSGGQRIPRREPDYADPVYLAKHGAFLKALGARYDGHPAVEFLDIGSYGVWGEWHTKHPAPVETRRQIVDLYLQAFRRTPLVFMSDDAEVLGYALEHGTGFRRDGVGSPWHEENWIGSRKYAGVAGMAETWTRAPVVFEWFGDYAYLQSRQWSFEAAVKFMLNHHVTLINDNLGRFPPEARPLVDQLTRRAGARLVPRRLLHPARIVPGATATLRLTWANVGVARLNREYVLQFHLLDAEGRSVVVGRATADPRTWLPGETEIQESLAVPASVAPGDYRLAVALEDPRGQRPPFRLAIDTPQVDGRHVLSRISVK